MEPEKGDGTNLGGLVSADNGTREIDNPVVFTLPYQGKIIKGLWIKKVDYESMTKV